MTGAAQQRVLLGGLAGASVTLPATAMAERIGQAVGVEIAWWRVAWGLILCLILAVLGALALRSRLGPAPRLGPGGGASLLARLGAVLPSRAPTSQRLRLVESLRINAQLEVSLFTCDTREILIATTPQGAFVVPEGGGAAGRPTP